MLSDHFSLEWDALLIERAMCNMLLTCFQNLCESFLITKKYMIWITKACIFPSRKELIHLCVRLPMFVCFETNTGKRVFVYPPVNRAWQSPDAVYFLPVSFVKYWDSGCVLSLNRLSMIANFLSDCCIVICIPNQSADSHYNMLSCYLESLSSFSRPLSPVITPRISPFTSFPPGMGSFCGLN